MDLDGTGLQSRRLCLYTCPFQLNNRSMAVSTELRGVTTVAVALRSVRCRKRRRRVEEEELVPHAVDIHRTITWTAERLRGIYILYNALIVCVGCPFAFWIVVSRPTVTIPALPFTRAYITFCFFYSPQHTQYYETWCSSYPPWTWTWTCWC
jgi:hypothetical protein